MATTKHIVVRVNANVKWKTRQTQAGNYVAICDPLGLTLQAETWADLMEDISLTLDAMLKDLLSSQELDQFLREHGWTLIGSIPNRQEDFRFDLPFFPEMMGPYGPQRSLHQ